MPRRESTAVIDRLAPATALCQEPQAPPKPKPIPPATPKPARPDIGELVRRRAAESNDLLQAAEEILFRLAASENPSPDEHSLLVSLGLTGDKLKSETNRVTRIASWREKSGTEAEREQARQAAETAASNLAWRAPEIAAEVQRLQAELATLEMTAERTRVAVERQSAALASLRVRDLLPIQRQAEYDDLARQRSPLLARINTLRGEIQRTELLAGMQPTDRACIEFAEVNRLPCFRREKVQHDSDRGVVEPNGWKAYIAQRQVDDEGRRAELEPLEAESAALDARREALLSFYVK